MAGRKPKPTAIKKLEGNPGKRKLNTKEPILKLYPHENRPSTTLNTQLIPVEYPAFCILALHSNALLR